MRKIIKDKLPELIKIRKHFHANPELSGEEYKTSKYVANYLKKHTNAKVVEGIGKTGVLATFTGKKRGKVVAIRGDMDALPIIEKNRFKHRSKSKGVAHMCGHDGHTAILIGLALLLNENPPGKGKVHLLFQPAEENGMGAAAVLRDKRFNRLKIDYIFALHNLPGYKKNEVVIRHGNFTANVKSLIVKFIGKTAHAAEPENGVNPAMAMSELLIGANEITHNKPEDEDFFLVTPVHTVLGDKSYGISAGYGEVHLTIRSWDTKLMKKNCDLIVNRLHENAKLRGLRVKTSWTQVFEANINNKNAVSFLEKAAKSGKHKVTKRKYPFKWGEDFGLFTQKYKGAMFGVGSGKSCPALHNPDYDFPDDIMPVCIEMFYDTIQNALK